MNYPTVVAGIETKIERERESESEQNERKKTTGEYGKRRREGIGSEEKVRKNERPARKREGK